MAFVGAPLPPRPPEAQSYANHVHRPVATVVGGGFAVFGLAFAFVYGLNDGPRLAVLSLVSLALAVTTLVIMSRTYTVRLQNRIIRLEMQLRLARLGRGDLFAHLSMPQIAALRFASDAEMPELLDRAIGENLSGDQIKRAVKDWQGDSWRT
jgi:hypothetical protein